EDGKSSTTIAWVNAEDRLAQDYLARLPRHQQLQNRFKELFYINQVFTPKQEGQRLFYERRKRDQEKPVFLWQDLQTSQEHVLLDPNRFNADEHVSLGEWYPSRDGRFLAYLLKENNSDEAVLHVRDV